MTTYETVKNYAIETATLENLNYVQFAHETEDEFNDSELSNLLQISFEQYQSFQRKLNKLAGVKALKLRSKEFESLTSSLDTPLTTEQANELNSINFSNINMTLDQAISYFHKINI